MVPSAEQADIINRQLMTVMQNREHPKTFCPSEVARAFTRSELQALGARHWKDTMEAVREVVWHFRDDGKVEILQKGQELSNTIVLKEIHGPIRIRAKQN
jgi:hypothetical protein